MRRLMVDRAVFEENFWWCYDRFQQQATPEVGVPGYFRFMTLLGRAGCESIGAAGVRRGGSKAWQ